MDEKISVIVPVYNSEIYLEGCIKSILEQSFVDFELILVDDGSTDSSALICDNFAKTDQRVKVVHVENGGAGAARKVGVAIASNEWIFFSDSDDTLPKNAFSDLICLVREQTSVDIVVGTFRDGPFIYKNQKVGNLSAREYVQAVLLLETHVGPWAKLIKKRLFQGFDWNTAKDITQNEDLLMLVGISQNAKSVCVDNDLVCYNFIGRPNSASTKIMPYEGWEKLFKELERCLELEDTGIQKAFTIYRLRALYSYLILRGFRLDAKQYPYVVKLLSDCEKGLALTKQDKKIVAVIRNVTWQKINYVFFCLKKKAMNPLDRMAYKLKQVIG